MWTIFLQFNAYATDQQHHDDFFRTTIFRRTLFQKYLQILSNETHWIESISASPWAERGNRVWLGRRLLTEFG